MRRALIVILALLFPTVAWAQFAPVQIPPAQQLWTVDTVDERVIDDVVRGDTADELQAADFSFSSSPERTRENLAQLVDQARSQSPALADKLELFFASADVIGVTGGLMRGVGLDPHNVADVYALWWVTAWSAANGKETPSDAATYQAVQRQAHKVLGSVPDFTSTPDAYRQQYAEGMMVRAALLGSMSDEVQGKADQTKQVAALARQITQGTGFDLDTMVLTHEGFRPRQGAALDSTADDITPQFSSSNALSSKGEGGGFATYLTIAAVIGAGLGAVYLLGRVVSRRG